MKKGIFVSLLSVVICLSVVPIASANTSISLPLEKVISNSDLDTKKEQVPFDLSIQKKLVGSEKVSITDKSQLERIALEEGLEKVPVRIEYEYTPLNVQKNLSIIPDQFVTASETVLSITTWDQGHGFYNSSSDLYKEFYVNGPDTFVIEETAKKYSNWTGSFGFSKAPIEAKIGFTIGKESTMRWESTTPITASQNIHFQLYTTYHKVSYSINTNLQSYGGIAYDPTGVFIKKTFY
ncbi:hypothetical protein D3C74_233900 [compost metagenome]